jgi:hypothetical protein
VRAQSLKSVAARSIIKPEIALAETHEMYLFPA